jgi:tetratricopeptide (TPR) repeat protein
MPFWDRIQELVGSVTRPLFPRSRWIVEGTWRRELERISQAVRERRYDRIEATLRDIEDLLPRIEPDSGGRVRKLNQLGDLFQEMTGSNLDAERLYRQALSAAETELDPTDDARILSMNNLGLLLLDLRRFAEAAFLFERALSQAERQFGGESLEAAACLENLAAVYRRTDRTSEAERLRSRATRIRRGAGRHDPSAPGQGGVRKAAGFP